MKKIILTSGLVLAAFFLVVSYAGADICKTDCRTGEGVICLERGPCQPISDILLKAAKECRDGGTAKYAPIKKLLFVDVLSEVLRLTAGFYGQAAELTDQQRYELETNLLAQKGLGMFTGTDPQDNLTREELAAVLKDVVMEKDFGLSSGLSGQTFELDNEKFVIYDVKFFVDEGNGFEEWERSDNFEQSASDSRHYSAKVTGCNDGLINLGDGSKGRIPVIGSKMKANYKIYGREDEVVTECEIVMLLSNPLVSASVKDKYNPSRPLTKANFADLLIKTMHLENRLPLGHNRFNAERLYLSEAEVLSRNGITIFTGANPNDLLTREELARVLYDHPVTELLGVSNGKENQFFEMNNAGFVIYDLHAYVNEGVKDEEWSRKDNFVESSSDSRDYMVKMDSGSYASVYFGDGKKGYIPPVNSSIKVSYRLYAPHDMFNEDDIICVLAKLRPIAEAYEPPPGPPDFP
ncbi:MAG: hypothetical protein WC569_06250, partial [Candidatus Omnitrophota bacterium]